MEDVEKDPMSLLLESALESSPSVDAANPDENASSLPEIDTVGETSATEQGVETTENLMESEQEGAMHVDQDEEAVAVNEDGFIVQSLEGSTEQHQEMEMMDVAFEDPKDDHLSAESSTLTTQEQVNEPMEIPEGTVSTSEGYSEDQFMSGTDALIVQNEPPQQLMEEADTPGEAPTDDMTTDIGETAQMEDNPTSGNAEEFFTFVEEKTDETSRAEGESESLPHENNSLRDDALESLVALQDSEAVKENVMSDEQQNEANSEEHLELPTNDPEKLPELPDSVAETALDLNLEYHEEPIEGASNIEDQLPTEGELPSEGALPTEGEMDTEGGTATESNLATGGELPTEGEMASEGGMATEDELPTGDGATGGDLSADGGVPAEGVLPVTDEMSSESNIPVESAAPTDSEMPAAGVTEASQHSEGFTLMAGSDNMEESLGNLEGKLVVGADGTVHLLSQESLQGIQLMEGDETSEEQDNGEQAAAQLQQVFQAQLQEALLKQEEIKREEEENRPEPDPSPGDQPSAESDALATLASAALDHQAPSNGVKNEPDAPEMKTEQDSNEPQWMDVGICKGTNCVVRSFYIPSEGQSWDRNWENINTSTLPDHRALAKLELEAGKAYKFRVAAINSCGRGPWSEITAFRTSMPGVPGAPSAIKISKTVEGAHLSWDPPAATSGTIEDYTVYMAVRSATTDSQVVSSGATQLAFVRIYQGAENQCSVGFETLTEAHIDTTTKPAILFRIAARNEKGLGPAIQVRWLQDGAAPNSAKPVNAPIRRVGGEIKPHTSIKRKKSECE